MDPSSANFINFIGTNTTVHPAFGGEVSPGSVEIYGFPYVVVTGTQPKKTVAFVEFPDESDGVGVPFYPIPDQAITTPHWIEGGEPGNQNPSGDRHMLIVDRDNELLYELYHVFFDTGQNRWEAGSGAFFDMKTNDRRPEGWTSADAAGLAILPGLVRYDEAYLEPGPIQHAFRVTVQATNGHVFPASHTAGSTSGALPMGARLRLKPGVTVASPDVGVQRMVQAMKAYGLIVADNGSNLFVSGTFDTRWDNDVLNPALANLQASDFEVIQLGYGSNFADLSLTKSDGQTTASPGGMVTYSLVASNLGPSAVTEATVADSFPAAITSVSWTCTASSGSSCGTSSGTGNVNHTVNLAVGGTATFTAVATLSASATGTLSNTATVSSSLMDPVPSNNSAIDTDTIVPIADLSITKTDGQATGSPSTPVTYTIVASDAGPNAATGATVTDTVPAALTGVSWSCVGAGGGTCPASGSGNINASVNLPVGGSVTFTLSGTVAASPSGLINTATVSVPGGMSDPNLSNNSATDEDLLLCFGERVVVPDGRLTEGVIGASSTTWFLARLKGGSSYSLEFKNTTGGSSVPGTLTVFSGADGCSGTSTLLVRDTVGIEPGGGAGSRRVSFTAGSMGSFFRARLVNEMGAPITYSFSWSETTLYSAAWSTNGRFDSFYSFQNTTGASVSGTLTLRDASGGGVSSFPVMVPAGQTTSVNTLGLGVIRQKTGTARFSHDGPPGAVVAEAAIANYTISPAYVQPVKFQAR